MTDHTAMSRDSRLAQLCPTAAEKGRGRGRRRGRGRGPGRSDHRRPRGHENNHDLLRNSGRLLFRSLGELGVDNLILAARALAIAARRCASSLRALATAGCLVQRLGHLV